MVYAINALCFILGVFVCRCYFLYRLRELSKTLLEITQLTEEISTILHEEKNG